MARIIGISDEAYEWAKQRAKKMAPQWDALQIIWQLKLAAYDIEVLPENHPFWQELYEQSDSDCWFIACRCKKCGKMWGEYLDVLECEGFSGRECEKKK